MNYLLIQDIKSLLYAVNLGCIDLNPFFSRYQFLKYPDFLVFDLDPENISFDKVIETALALHELLDQLKVPNYCKTSGARGLHVLVPLNAKYTYNDAKLFAQLIAQIVHQRIPLFTSLTRSPPKRKKKVYIDCLQNNFAQTLAAPYSVRAKRHASVSMPLEWKEVKKGLDPSQFNIFNAVKRVKSKKDILKGFISKTFDMKKVMKKIAEL